MPTGINVLDILNMCISQSKAAAILYQQRWSELPEDHPERDVIETARLDLDEYLTSIERLMKAVADGEI